MIRSFGSLLQKTIGNQMPKLRFVTVPRYTFAGGKGGTKKKEQKLEQTKEKKSIRDSLVNAEEIDLEGMEKSMTAIMKSCEKEYQNLKPGRINVRLFQQITTKINGQSSTIAELAQIVSTQNQGCIINPYVNETTDSIIKALQTTQHGFHIQRKGQQLVLTLAGANTKESKDLVLKKLKSEYDSAKEQVNNERYKSYKEIQKYKKIASQDIVKRSQTELQKIYQKITKDMETNYKNKAKEIAK